MVAEFQRGDNKEHKPARMAVWLAFLVASLVLIRDLILVWAFSLGYYRDSNLYVNLGSTLFQKGGPFSAGIVSLPYPFFNALTVSASNPLRLVWVQILIGAIAVGSLIYVIARINLALAGVTGLVLVLDLVWGAINRNLMTEGLFVSFNILSLAVMVNHYRKRRQLSSWELLAAGLLYGWTFIFRPSSLFLTFLVIPLYIWMTRSWYKTALLTGGLLVVYVALGTFNLWSSGEFRLMGQTGYYTGSPLFVYRLFSPANGPSSRQLDIYLSACLPGVDYPNVMDTTPGGTKNNEILYGQFIPCLSASGLDLDQTSELITQAYKEGVISHPIYYLGVLLREGVTFIRYNVPNILRFYLKPELNNKCETYSWCEHIRQARFSWGNDLPLARTYEKTATKLIQIYLVPIVPLSWAFPADGYLPYAVAWSILLVFLLLTTRGEVRFLVVVTVLFLHYIVLSVVAGYGFLERYATVLTPLYIILSATALVTLGEYAWRLKQRLSRQVER